MLQRDYGNSDDEELILNLELNVSLAQKHFHSNYANAIANSLRVIEKYKDTSFQNLIARHYWLVGHCYANQGQHDRADEYLASSLKAVVKQEPISTALHCDILSARAMNEEFRTGANGSEKAAEYLREAFTVLTPEEGFDIRRANCRNGLGNICINCGKIDEALEHYLYAAAIYERFFDLANMASAYSNIGTCYIERKEWKEAEHYMEKSLDLRMKLGSPDHLSVSYYNLAIIHKDTGRLDSAYNYALRSKEILEQTGHMPYMRLTDDLLQAISQAQLAESA